MKKINIALLGFGIVGTGTWKIIQNNGPAIEQKTGCRLEVKKILVKNLHKKRAVVLPEGILTDDYDSIAGDRDIDIIVEVIGGVFPAKDYILRGLAAGKHVVTANKMLLARHGSEIFEAAQSYGKFVRYEASVCGGIPIIHALQESLLSNEIEEITGILNGTTNYILTNMSEKGQDYKEALKEAQALGYAEADPAFDVEGQDSAFKLAILTHLSFGLSLDGRRIPQKGITEVTLQDIAAAKQSGYCIKLLAHAKKSKSGYSMSVGPQKLPLQHPLAGVKGVNNGVLIRGNAVQELMFYGQGAGEMPTGSAVVSDIVALAKQS